MCRFRLAANYSAPGCWNLRLRRGAARSRISIRKREVWKLVGLRFALVEGVWVARPEQENWRPEERPWPRLWY